MAYLVPLFVHESRNLLITAYLHDLGQHEADVYDTELPNYIFVFLKTQFLDKASKFLIRAIFFKTIWYTLYTQFSKSLKVIFLAVPFKYIRVICYFRTFTYFINPFTKFALFIFQITKWSGHDYIILTPIVVFISPIWKEDLVTFLFQFLYEILVVGCSLWKILGRCEGNFVLFRWFGRFWFLRHDYKIR